MTADRDASRAKREARRATLDAATVAAEVAKAAWARRALQARGDAFLRSAGPLVLGMRAHNRAFSEIAKALEARGIKTALGAPWTGFAAGSVAQRIRARTAAGDGFSIEPEPWEPPAKRARPPIREDPQEVAFREARALWKEQRQADEAVWVEATRTARETAQAKRQARADAKKATLKARQATREPAIVEADIARAGHATAAAASRAAAVRAVALPIAMELRRSGMTLDKIAIELTRRGITRAHGGGRWGKPAVSSLLKRGEVSGQVTPPALR